MRPGRSVACGLLLVAIAVPPRVLGTGGVHDGTIKARVWAVDPPLKIGTVMYRPGMGMLKVKIKSSVPADDDIPCDHPGSEIVCSLTDRAWVPSSDAWIDTHLWFRLEPNGNVAQINVTDTNLVGLGGSLHNVWGVCFRTPVTPPTLDSTAAAPYDCVGRDLPPVTEPSGPAAAMF